ncbi:MAG: NAD(P)-binding domain-containing protein [bacterium]|nr:NAD(P)-binding domain-containing protein [bacterium]
MLSGLTVGFFGLGEAGSLISADLAAAGATVTGYDPAPTGTPQSVRRVTEPKAAVEGADLVMAATAAGDAMAALTQALDAIPAGAVYADLSTAPAERKRDLAKVAAGRSLLFVDVALMAMVPGNGLFGKSLASGPGAERYVGTLSPIGVPVEWIGDEPGAAATRKLLRSVVMKGLPALLIEAMRAAAAAGLSEETWENVIAQLTSADETFLRTLLEGTDTHSERRHAEMQAATELLESLGIEPTMTRGTVESLHRMPTEGLPEIPPP